MPAWMRLILAGYLLAGSCLGDVYYVATYGNDLLDGSSEGPFRTLARAAKAARAGDTVIVRDGIYGHEDAVTGGDFGPDSDNNRSPVKLENSGNLGAWIAFRAEHKWGAILDCEMLCDAYFDLYNSSYIVIQDFVITGGFKEGIHSNDAAHHVVIRGNRIENIANRSSASPYGRDGLYTGPNCHDFLIEGNVFHDIGRTDPSNLDHALYLRGDDFTVVNNIFYNIQRGYAMQLADGLNNILIANNTFAFPRPGSDLSGHIMLWRAQNNLTIRNNIFYGQVEVPAAVVRYLSVVNNCTIDHNLVFGASAVLYTGLLNLGDCALNANGTGADPQFLDSMRFDFHLMPGSPALDSAVELPGLITDFDGVLRPQGAAYDIGAFEFIAPAPDRAVQDAPRARLGPHSNGEIRAAGAPLIRPMLFILSVAAFWLLYKRRLRAGAGLKGAPRKLSAQLRS